MSQSRRSKNVYISKLLEQVGIFEKKLFGNEHKL